jgi:hypothetical protein
VIEIIGMRKSLKGNRENTAMGEEVSGVSRDRRPSRFSTGENLMEINPHLSSFRVPRFENQHSFSR